MLTDYPDAVLIDNLQHNVARNISAEQAKRVYVEVRGRNSCACLICNDRDFQGYIWGRPLDSIFSKQQAVLHEQGFDLIIMSDLIFNHSQVISHISAELLKLIFLFFLSKHDALLQTAELALKPATTTSTPQPSVLAFFSHHRPHLADRDMEFFTKAKERGWHCEKILTEKFPVGDRLLTKETASLLRMIADVS